MRSKNKAKNQFIAFPCAFLLHKVNLLLFSWPYQVHNFMEPITFPLCTISGWWSWATGLLIPPVRIFWPPFWVMAVTSLYDISSWFGGWGVLGLGYLKLIGFGSCKVSISIDLMCLLICCLSCFYGDCVVTFFLYLDLVVFGPGKAS